MCCRHLHSASPPICQSLWGTCHGIGRQSNYGERDRQTATLLLYEAHVLHHMSTGLRVALDRHPCYASFFEFEPMHAGQHTGLDSVIYLYLYPYFPNIAFLAGGQCRRGPNSDFSGAILLYRASICLNLPGRPGPRQKSRVANTVYICAVNITSTKEKIGT